MRQELLPSMRKELSPINHREGFSIVEVMLAGSVFVLLVTTLVGAYLYGQESTALAGNRARATLLAEEGMEATRNIRDAGFNNLTDGTHGLSVTGNEWNLFGSSDTTDIFTRSITIATVDTKRKNVTSQVTWQQNPQRNGSVTLISRFTNWIASGIGDWTNPFQEDSLNLSGNTDGIKIQLSGNYAYVVRDGGNDFVVIDISTPASPSVVASLSLPGTLSNVFVSGNYAYVTSNDNSSELMIVNISTPSSPSIIGTYNDSGNDDATGVFVSGNYAYVTFSGGNDIVIVNISAPSSPTFTGGISLNGNAYEVVVDGNFAYVSSSDNTQELQIVNVSTPSAPILSGTLNLSGNADATTISISDGTVLIGQGSDLRIIDVALPAAPALLGSVNTSGTVNDVALNLGNSNTYAYIATSDNSLEFQVIDISTLTAPIVLGSINSAGNDNLNGIAYNSVLDRAFGVGDSDNEEFFVFSPQ